MRSVRRGKELVTITKEQHEAIKYADLCLKMSGEELVLHHATEPHGWGTPLSALNGMDLDTLITAVYVGYKIEKTKQDILQDAINGVYDVIVTRDLSPENFEEILAELQTIVRVLEPTLDVDGDWNVRHKEEN